MQKYLKYLILIFTDRILEITNLHVDVINVSTAVARWDPVPKEHIQGVHLTGYTVGLRILSSDSIPNIRTNKTTAVFGDLTDSLEYVVSVSASTTIGSGQISRYTLYTGNF